MTALFENAFSAVVAAGLASVTMVTAYLWLIAAISFAVRKGIATSGVEPVSRFAFVVPAHNEEEGVAATVNSLLSVDYPPSLFEVVVVADNCTDMTAEMAVSTGATCLERHDPDLRGKGYALRFAFDSLLQRRYDAYVVIDADSIVSRNFLSVLDVQLREGKQVIQAWDGISNPNTSSLTYLFQVGNIIENRLYWEVKQRLGLPIFLKGNGMCFGRDVLERYPWGAFSITEDTEYGLRLIGAGVRVHFVPEIAVLARQPETLQQAFMQRVRWAAGNSNLTKGRALKLMAAGVVKRDLCTFDLGFSLIAGSRPLMLVANLLLVGLSALLKSPGLFAWGALVLLAQLLYITLGIALNGLSWQKLRCLLLSPFYLVWLCMVSVLGTAGYRKNQWVRTARS